MSCACPPSPCCTPPQLCQPDNFGLQFPSLVGPMGPPGGPGLYVENYDELRILDASAFVAGYVANVGGYSTWNDGGGGQFLYDPSGVEADDDGTILAPTNGIGRWRRLFSGMVNIKWFGAVGDFTADDTAAIQGAIDVAYLTGAGVYVPGTASSYRIVPATAAVYEGGNITIAFTIRSNMHIVSDPWATFKLANNQSTDAVPKVLGMFFTNQVLSNVSWRFLQMDMNGANNLISPNRGVGTYNRFDQAHIMVSGTPGGVAARIENALVSDCRLINTAGVCCILMAQSNVAGITLAKGWTIKNTVFKDNGTDTDDHSSVYAWANDVLCDGCIFTNTTFFPVSGNATGGKVAFEVHGSNTRFVNNFVYGYLRGLWVSGNLSTTVENTVIANNTIWTKFYGVDFFRDAAAVTPTRGTLISTNVFIIQDGTFAGAPTQQSVINIAPEFAVTDITISNNEAYTTGSTVSKVFLTVTVPGGAAQIHDRIVCRNNACVGFTGFSTVRASATTPIGSVTISDNEIFNLIDSTLPAGTPVACYSDGAAGIRTLTYTGNSFIDTQTVPTFQSGIYIAGPVTSLRVGPNIFKGLTVSDYSEVGAPVITNRWMYVDKQAYVPTITIGGVSAAAFVTETADFHVHGKQVTVNVEIVVTNAGALTAGNIFFSIPFAAGSAGRKYIGSWFLNDASASLPYGGVCGVDGTGTDITMYVGATGLVTTASPVAIANDDRIVAQITYDLP